MDLLERLRKLAKKTHDMSDVTMRSNQDLWSGREEGKESKNEGWESRDARDQGRVILGEWWRKREAEEENAQMVAKKWMKAGEGKNEEGRAK